MKSFQLISTFLFIALFSNAQTVESFKEKWDRVRVLEVNGRLEDASLVLDSIAQEATKTGNKQQHIKVFLFKSKYKMVREENAEQRIIADLDTLIKTAVFPEKNIYQSIYAHLLYGHLQQNQYRIRQRTAGGVMDKTDFLTWDIHMFYTQIHQRYALALSDAEKLVKLPVKDYELLLDLAPQTRVLQPSLLDMIASEAMSFYKNDNYFIDQPQEHFELSTDNVYLASTALLSLKALVMDSLNNDFKVLQLYGLLETLHLENGSLTAHIYNYKNRLHYGYKKTGQNKEVAAYETALKALLERYKNEPEITTVYHTLASYYNDLSEFTPTETTKAWREKSIQTAQDGAALFKESYGALQCQLLLDAIYNPELTLQVENYASAKDNKRAVLSYRNVAAAQVLIVPVPLNQQLPRNSQELNAFYRKLIEKALANKNQVFDEQLTLTNAADTFEHSLSFNIPPLATGKYLVQVVSANQEKEAVNYTFFEITNLTLFTENESTKTTFTVLDRVTGKPVKHAKLYLSSGNRNYGYQPISKKNSMVLKTNRHGKAILEKNTIERRNNNTYYNILATKKKDSLLSAFSNYYYNNNNIEAAGMLIKPFIYLDRAIYRPGQTVYFKAILAAEKEGKSQIVPNYTLSVYVEDVNGQEIFETDLKTNEWGSIKGSFVLPKDGLTGSFTIYVEDNEDNTDGTNIFSNADEWDDAQLSFQVEEYKRPRFKATLDEITKTFKVNDSITVTGKAQALLGSAVTNAAVTYTVNRTVSYQGWRYGYFNTTDKIIAEGTTKTDAKGSYSITFLAEPDSAVNQEIMPVFNYVVNVTITDVNGETRTTEKIVRVGYHTLELQLISQRLLDLENNEIQVQARNLNGKTVPAQIRIEVKKPASKERVIIPQVLPQSQFYTMDEAAYKTLYPYAPPREQKEETDWKTAATIYAVTQTVDTLTTIKLPIDATWRNGDYYLVATAAEPEQSLDDEAMQVIEKREQRIWTNKEQSLEPSIVTTNTVSTTATKAIIDFFTAMDEVIVSIKTWDAQKVQEERIVTLKYGKTRLAFDLTKIDGTNLNLSYAVQKENSFTTGYQTFSKPIVLEKNGTIETKTFRDLLKPGEQETWSFTLKNKDGLAMQAETLASMYDASLDTFATASWDPFSFYRYTNDFYPASMDERSRHSKQYLGIQMEQNKRAYNMNLEFERFNYFGLSFQNFNRSFQNYRNKMARASVVLKPQAGMVVGKVTDETGEGIVGVTVKIKGTQEGTTTDFDGNYMLAVTGNETLVFNFIGYTTNELQVNNRQVLNATLTTDGANLEAVVVQYYSKSKNMMVTAPMENEVADVVPLMRSLSGQVAGLQIVSAPGATDSLIIRGAASIKDGVTPLYIVDGVPVNEATFKALNPAMIKELAVLKDASATAIYGNRGANGVLIISTKDGVSTNDLVLQAMALNNVQARKNLDETAFFLPELYTDADGNLSFTFTTPEALTQWKLRLFAHDKQAKTATLEKLVRTQKELSLAPNAPRFLRETDTIRFSTKIANLTNDKLSGLATLKLFDASTMQPVDDAFNNTDNVQNFEVDGNGNTSINFTFTVPKGAPAVTYRVIASSGTFSDGEENTLPVLTNRMLVNESRALWVRAGKTNSVTMENLANNTSTTLDNFKLTFEYTSNPAWYAIKSLPYMMEYEHECAEQTFSRYYANAVASHIISSNPQIKAVFDSWAQNGSLKSNLEKNEELKSIILAHTPWLIEGQSETEQQQRLAVLFDAARNAREKQRTLRILEENQLDDGAFSWWKGGRANDYITRHIAAGIGHLAKLQVEDMDSLRSNAIYNKAIAYNDAQWTKRLTDYVKYNKKNKLNDYAFGVDYWHYLYARSFKNTTLQDKILVDAREYAFAKAEKEHANLPLYTKLLYTIVLHRAGKTAAAQKILEGIKQTAVVSEENGMYWKNNVNSWYWFASDIETHALAIETFSEVTNDLQTVEELKIWLLKNKRTTQWKSTKATADASYALLLQGNDWLSVQENNAITWGDAPIPKKLLETTTKEAGTGYFKVALSQDEITPKMATVTVANNSAVTGYGGLYWQYFEDLDNIKTDDKQPLSVKKELYKKVNTPQGEQLIVLKNDEILKIGDLVTVRIEIRSNTSMDYVHLKDMRASGFEPVDVVSTYRYQDGLGYYQSTKDVASHFFFDRLDKGTYVFQYEVRANNAGSFSNGITKLECMYAPEFASHSAGKRVVITE